MQGSDDGLDGFGFSFSAMEALGNGKGKGRGSNRKSNLGRPLPSRTNSLLNEAAQTSHQPYATLTAFSPHTAVLPPMATSKEKKGCGKTAVASVDSAQAGAIAQGKDAAKEQATIEKANKATSKIITSEALWKASFANARFRQFRKLA